MMSPEVLSYQFDDVVIDLRAGRVLRAGIAAPLEPKAYDLLVLLVSRSGELVTRQEVLDRVWAGVYVTDNAVARVIAQVRRVLGDSARGSRYIETVPTRGYRFIVPVTPRYANPNLAATAWPAAGAAGASGASVRTDELPPGPGERSTAPLASQTASGAEADVRTGHPLWAAGLAVVALVAILLAWRSQTTSSSGGAPGITTRTQITSSPGLDAYPAWSPDGHTLAYASDRGGRFEIFLRDLAAGGDRIALTADRQHNVQPAWSPDGARVAYHSSGRGGIWVVDRSGGSPVQVSRFGSRPAWSPDGTRIAFQGAPYTEPGGAAFETFGPSSLWVVGLDGGEPRMATFGWRPQGSHVRPTWFPDGRRLFFASQRLDTTDFWTVDLASGAVTRILEVRARAIDATLTPDGRAVYYVLTGDHYDLWELRLREDGTAAGPARQAMPPGELDIRHVAVHPRGDQLAYVGMATVAGLRSLALRRDGNPAGPSERIAEDAVRRARRPSFSPDGRQVAFERQASGGPPGLWLLDLAKGSVRALTAGTADARDPVWSRDGSRVYFESGLDGDVVLEAMRIDDGAIEVVARLADGGHTLLRPRVSPDGTQLAYTRSSDGQLEVWTREMATGRDTRVARLGDGAALPTWSPDGRALAVDVWREGHAQVYVADLTTGDITQVSRSADQAWVRSWSPDGRHIAFAASTDGRWNVWTVRRDGTGLRQLTDYGDEHHYVRNPEWSPSGDRLVYEFATFSGNIWAVPIPRR